MSPCELQCRRGFWSSACAPVRRNHWAKQMTTTRGATVSELTGSLGRQRGRQDIRGSRATCRGLASSLRSGASSGKATVEPCGLDGRPACHAVQNT